MKGRTGSLDTLYSVAATLCGLAVLLAGGQILWNRAHSLSLLSALVVLATTGAAGVLFLICSRRDAFWQRQAVPGIRVLAPVFRMDRADRLWLLGLTLLAALPRLAALRSGLWWDELWTSHFMRNGPIFAVTRQAQFNNHLLNSLLGSLVLDLDALFHGGRLPADYSWYPLTRIPATIFGIASIPLLYWTLRPYFARPVAIGAALLLALSPAAVDLAAQSRGYSGLIFFAIGQGRAFAQALAQRTPRSWLAWLAWSVLGALSHNYMAFPVVVCGICAVMVAIRGVGRWAPNTTDRNEKAPGGDSRANPESNEHGSDETLWTFYTPYSSKQVWLKNRPGGDEVRGDESGSDENGSDRSEPDGSSRADAARSLIESAALMIGIWALLVLAGYAAMLGVMLAELKVEAAMRPEAYAHGVLLPMLQNWAGVPPASWLIPSYLYCAVLVTMGARYLQKHAPGIGLYFALLLLLPPIVVEGVRPHFVYIRFFAYGLPAFLTWMTVGMWATARRWTTGPPERGYAVLVGIWLLMGLPGLWQTVTMPKQDYEHAARFLIARQRAGDSIVEVGPGCRYMGGYGFHTEEARSVPQLQAFVRQHGEALVVYSNLIRCDDPALPGYLRQVGGRPLTIFHGRFPQWPARDTDCDSDLIVYQLRADGQGAP